MTTPPPSGLPQLRRRVALIDSGLGLVAYAAALLDLRPDLSLVLSTDPDHMPYGPRTPDDVRRLVLALAHTTLPLRPDAIVVACNTASVHGLEVLRAELEPEIPVIVTVPAIRPAAAAGGPVAIWSTAATADSDYLRRLIRNVAPDTETHVVAAHGLAEAIESTDFDAVDRCIGRAIEVTPAHVHGLVLGCTHYGLVTDRIAAAVTPGLTIFDSPAGVARQTLRRLGLEANPAAYGGGIEAVLQSGRAGTLPTQLAAYPAGRRLLAAAPVCPGPAAYRI